MVLVDHASKVIERRFGRHRRPGRNTRQITAIDIRDVERYLTRARGSFCQPPALHRRETPPDDIHLTDHRAATHELAIHVLKIGERESRIDWLFEKRGATPGDEKKDKCFFAVVRAQDCERRLGGFEACLIWNGMTTEDDPQTSWCVTNNRIRRNQTIGETIAEKLFDHTRRCDARFANPYDYDSRFTSEIDCLIACNQIIA